MQNLHKNILSFLALCSLGFFTHISAIEQATPTEKTKKPSLAKKKIKEDAVENNVQNIDWKKAYRVYISTKRIGNGETPWWPRWGEPRV